MAEIPSDEEIVEIQDGVIGIGEDDEVDVITEIEEEENGIIEIGEEEAPEDGIIIEEEESPEDGMIEIQEQGAVEIAETVSQGEEQVQWRPTPSRSFTIEYWKSKLRTVKIRKEDLNKLVMNFLVAEGLVEVAEKFQKESGTKRILVEEFMSLVVILGHCYLFDQETAEVEFASIKERMDIVKAIQRGNLNDAVEKLNALNPEILKTNFLLNRQRLIEVIRMGTIEEAIAFAEKELKPFGEQNEEYLKELEKTLTLLCYKDVPTCPLRELLTNSQRFKTAEEVDRAILTSQTGEKWSKIQYMGHMLIWYQHLLADDSAEYPCMVVEPKKIPVRYRKIWYT